MEEADSDEIGRVVVGKQELLPHRIGMERLAFRVPWEEAGGLFQHPAGSIRWNAEQAEGFPVHGNRSRCECLGHCPRQAAVALL